MEIKKTIKNWRWWLIVFTWVPVVTPFVLIRLLITFIGVIMNYFGEVIIRLSDMFDSFLQYIFQSKKMVNWVHKK